MVFSSLDIIKCATFLYSSPSLAFSLFGEGRGGEGGHQESQLCQAALTRGFSQV